eukprot:31000-Rhodomonas_salina.3
MAPSSRHRRSEVELMLPPSDFLPIHPCCLVDEFQRTWPSQRSLNWRLDLTMFFCLSASVPSKKHVDLVQIGVAGDPIQFPEYQDLCLSACK